MSRAEPEGSAPAIGGSDDPSGWLDASNGEGSEHRKLVKMGHCYSLCEEPSVMRLSEFGRVSGSHIELRIRHD